MCSNGQSLLYLLELGSRRLESWFGEDRLSESLDGRGEVRVMKSWMKLLVEY